MAGVSAGSASSRTKAAGIAESSKTKRWDVAVRRRVVPPRGPMDSRRSPGAALAQRVAFTSDRHVRSERLRACQGARTGVVRATDWL